MATPQSNADIMVAKLAEARRETIQINLAIEQMETSVAGNNVKNMVVAMNQLSRGLENLLVTIYGQASVVIGPPVESRIAARTFRITNVRVPVTGQSLTGTLGVIVSTSP